MTDTLTAPTRVEQDCPVPECHWDTVGFVDPAGAYRGHVTCDHKPAELVATIEALQGQLDRAWTDSLRGVGALVALMASRRSGADPAYREACLIIARELCNEAENPNPAKESA